MKFSLLATTAFVALSSSVYASDLPSKKAPIAPVANAESDDWNGFYFGGAIGMGASAISFDDVTGRFNPIGTKYSSSANGFTVSARGGLNYQFQNRFVLGVETDYRYNNASSSNGYDGGTDLRNL